MIIIVIKIVALQIEYCEDKEKVIEDEHDEDGGWVDTHHYDNAGSPTVEEKVIILYFYVYTLLLLRTNSVFIGRLMIASAVLIKNVYQHHLHIESYTYIVIY